MGDDSELLNTLFVISEIFVSESIFRSESIRILQKKGLIRPLRPGFSIFVFLSNILFPRRSVPHCPAAVVHKYSVVKDPFGKPVPARPGAKARFSAPIARISCG